MVCGPIQLFIGIHGGLVPGPTLDTKLGGSLSPLTKMEFVFTLSPCTSFHTLYIISAAAAADAGKSLQSCPSLYGPIYGSPPVSPVPGILQARTLEWVAISFSNA